jgi:acyl-coenzyme A thioesterase PaaI-like protein
MTTSTDVTGRARSALAVLLQEALGARFVDEDDPGVVLPIGGLVMNPGGTLHAGALGVIPEITAFIALLPQLSVTEHAVTHHISTQILSPGRRDE